MKIKRYRTVRVATISVVILSYVMVSIASSSSIEFTTKSTTPLIQQPSPNNSRNSTSEDTTTQGALVDYDALTMVNRGDGITRLVGEVSFHHNGTIIQCDSAFMHPDDRMEFFDNVIIEKDSAIIYGDKVDYNQLTNKADIYAPIVKMMRGEATLYSYNLQFDTKTSIAVFHGGGILTQRTNEMEAERGEFDANASYVKFYDNVEMENASYYIATDSLGFSIEDERMDFIAHTDIWGKDGNFLQTDRGHYYSTTDSYLFTSNSYVLTSDNEIWADTMRYYTETRQAYMFSNVQILDTANLTIAYSDWAFYDDSVERAVLSDNPSIKSWRESGDSSYLRADTILLLTFKPGDSSKETLGGEQFRAGDASRSADNTSAPTSMDTMAMTSVMTGDSIASNIMGSTLFGDGTAPERQERSEGGRAEGGERPERSERPEDIPAPERTDTIEVDTIVADTTIIETIPSDTTIIVQTVDSTELGGATMLPPDAPQVDSLLADSLLTQITQKIPIDSTIVDSTVIESPVMDSTAVQPPAQDSTAVVEVVEEPEPKDERVIKAYNNVRMWNEQYQMKCDSLVTFTEDSTAHLFGLPVLWYYDNQISSEQMIAYTKNEELDWAEFIGSPVVSQQVIPGDTLLFNQAIGNLLETYFTDNEIDYAYMSGNVQNIYYMKEGEREITSMVAIDCADLTMFFADREPYKLLWGGKGSGPIYPMNQIPPTQSRFLTGFTWQSDIRPKRAKEICDRFTRLTVRSERESLLRPLYPIRDEMTSKMKELLKKGTWRDRTEIPTVTPEYFIERNKELLF